MNIVFIGAGNLATNLSVALHKAGHTIVQVYSRTDASAQALAKLVDACPITDISQITADADIYILCIADSAIHSLCSSEGFSSVMGQNHGESSKLIIHTAGSIPMDVITSKRRGVLYPMQSFSKQRIIDFTNIPVFIEASNPQDTDLLEKLAYDISDNVYRLSSADRLYLHLAAVFCSNFVNHCYALSDEILSQHNIPFSVMLPLIDEVATKVHTVAPKEAMTGPAVRHDMGVIGKHLQLLTDNPRLQQIYDMMSKSIIND